MPGARVLTVPSAFLFITGLLLSAGCATEDPAPEWDRVVGFWEGAFMPESGMNLTLVLHLFRDADERPQARVLLWEDSTQIQDDPLTRIRLNEDALSFYIEAKDTPFEGTLHPDSLRIEGRFLFPDGSAHPVRVRKVERPSLGDLRADSSLEFKDALHAVFTPAQLQEDLRFLRQALERDHPGLYAFLDQEAFDGQYADLYRSLDAPMPEGAFPRHIAPLVAAIRCAHTGVRPSDAFSNALERERRYFPFVVRMIDGRLFVLEGPGEAAPVVPGSEVVSINGVPAATLLSDLSARVPADGYNETYKVFQVNHAFPRLYAAYLGQPDRFELALRAPDDRRYTVEGAGLPFEEVGPRYPSVHPAITQGGALPLAFRTVDEADTGILAVGAFAAPDPERFMAYVADVFDELARKGIGHLILDLRGNSGGYPLLAADLLSYLADSAFVYFAQVDGAPVAFPGLYQPQPPRKTRFAGDVYILADGGCVSSAAHFISLVRYHGWGILVGEETGGTFYCHDNSVQVALPRTGIRVNIPRTAYQTAVSGYARGAGIRPDHPVAPTLQEVLDGVDAVMDYTLRLIRAQRAAAP